jgi:hypothetical protein
MIGFHVIKGLFTRVSLLAGIDFAGLKEDKGAMS